MTLIVAEIVNDQIQIISDTQITDRSLNKAINPLNGKLKTIIINPLLSISFSGVTSFGDELLKKIYKRQVHNIVISALESNMKSDNTVHFIVCQLIQNVPKLFIIKDRQVYQNAKAGYIGDGYAYKKYREFYSISEKETVFSKMIEAFEKVLEDESENTSTVGQFLTCVSTEAAVNVPLNFLGYQVNRLDIVGKQTLVQIDDNQYFIKTANANDGGFSHTYLRGFNPHNPAYAIHFHTGKFAILFYPAVDYGHKEICEPTIFLNQPDGEDFMNLLLKQYNLSMQGMVITKDGLGYRHHIAM
ncbi:MAG: hypothetical protein ACO1N9_01725 [Flavobacterium sp.]